MRQRTLSPKWFEKKIKACFGRNPDPKNEPSGEAARPGKEPARYVPATPQSEQIPAEVFATELATIRARRKACGLENLSEHDRAEPSQGLCGLALSGGGIRSATFNLGTTQALHRAGMFRHFDYLSTVSGGGYIGSCLSSVAASIPPESELSVIVDGMPEGAAFSSGVKISGNRWRLDLAACSPLTLTLPGRAAPYSLTLSQSVIHKNAAAETPLDGVNCRLDVTEAGDLHYRYVTVKDQPALSIDVPAGDRAAEYRIGLSLHLDTFPFRHFVGNPESESFRHLRDYSNYLVPRQFLAKLRLPGLFIRGLVVNFSMTLPILLLAALATVWIAGGKVTKAIEAEKMTLEVPAPPLTDNHPVDEKDVYHYNIDLEKSLANTAMVGSLNQLKADPNKCFFVTLDGVPDPIDIGPKATLTDKEWIVAGQVPENVYLKYPAGFRKPFTVTAVAWTEDMSPALCEKAHNGQFASPVRNPIDALSDSSLGLTKIVLIAALFVLGLYPLGQWLMAFATPTGWHSRDIISRWICGGVLLTLALFAAIALQPLAIYYFHTLSDTKDSAFGDFGELSTVLAGLFTMLGALFSGKMARRTAGLLGKIGLISLGILGPLSLWLVYLNLSRWLLVENTTPQWLPLLWSQAQIAGASGGGMIPELFQHLLNFIAGIVTALSDFLKSLLGFLHDGYDWNPHARNVAGSYGIVCLVIFVVTRLFYDVNATSFHGFYRDRLSKAYLFNPFRNTRSGRVYQNDEQKLSKLSQVHAPYHLINTTLNIQHSKTANLRGRGGSFFVFSREYSGSQLTGYRRTFELEEAHADLNLGTAMAISAAAASPNMGRNTMPSLVLIMTLLNIRLGYWFPHPKTFSGADYRHKYIRRALRLLASPFTRVTPYHLFMEMIGNLKETGWHVNLTDGGHLENLGLYELVRRRCKLIFAVDAEADPDMIFAGLADAIRLIRIDLGVEIEIDVDRIRLTGADGHSPSHYAVGRIHYGQGEYGYLVYLKSSTTGDEDVHIKEYDALEPTFPQQTTADQFFDESQFEAYRALGRHAMKSLFEHPSLSSRDMNNLADIMAGLDEIIAENDREEPPIPGLTCHPDR